VHTTLTKSFSFDSAHWLPTFPEGHKCRRLHGHTFHVDLLVHGEVDEARGYLIDFGQIKAYLAPIKDELDHRLLNEVPGLENPTAENLARWVYDRVKAKLPQLTTVRVRETCSSSAEYCGPTLTEGEDQA
jgi:6-pyruvoyltetrahydropterin/6-carboxytetrahydropterin synthase